MRHKTRPRQLCKKGVSWKLCASMMPPDMAYIVAEAGLGHIHRHVDFARLEALFLSKLGIGKPTSSDLHEPEVFYEITTDEADDILVQFDEKRNIWVAAMT